jgi:hypothetical protein
MLPIFILCDFYVVIHSYQSYFISAPQ